MIARHGPPKAAPRPPADQAPDFDAAYATDWLERILASEDERLLRFRALLAERLEG